MLQRFSLGTSQLLVGYAGGLFREGKAVPRPKSRKSLSDSGATLRAGARGSRNPVGAGCSAASALPAESDSANSPAAWAFTTSITCADARRAKAAFRVDSRRLRPMPLRAGVGHSPAHCLHTPGTGAAFGPAYSALSPGRAPVPCSSSRLVALRFAPPTSARCRGDTSGDCLCHFVFIVDLPLPRSNVSPSVRAAGCPLRPWPTH
jgi:hypothetical protein